jgi:hypothetical protein
MESMRTLMTYPQCPNTFWSFKHVLKFIQKKAALRPLGLQTTEDDAAQGLSKKAG